MIILSKGYAYNKIFPNSDWTGKAIQTIDDNSELGKKIISMIPYVKFIYRDGKVIDCEEIEHTEQEQIEQIEQNLTIEERVTTLESENESISAVLDALLMGDIEI